MQVRAPMIVHSSSMSQNGPFGNPEDDTRIWYTLTSPPPRVNPLERENSWTPPDTSINLAINRDMASYFPPVGSSVQVTINVEGDDHAR
jgi:hypothetical protein